MDGEEEAESSTPTRTALGDKSMSLQVSQQQQQRQSPTTRHQSREELTLSEALTQQHATMSSNYNNDQQRPTARSTTTTTTASADQMPPIASTTASADWRRQVADQTRRSLTNANERMGQSLRQLYVSASCIGHRAGAVAATSGAAANGAASTMAAAAAAVAAAAASATTTLGATTPGELLAAPVGSLAVIGPPDRDDAEDDIDSQHQPPPAYHNIPGTVPFYRGRVAGPPPSYDDVVNPFAAPPTYQSLFGQMREARKSSRGMVDLAWRLVRILMARLAAMIFGLFILLVILLPFAMIIVGATYIDDCRVEHIPMFLLVGGLVGAAWIVLNCYSQTEDVEQVQQQRQYSFNGHRHRHRSVTNNSYNNNGANREDVIAITVSSLAAPSGAYSSSGHSDSSNSTGDNDVPQAATNLMIDLTENSTTIGCEYHQRRIDNSTNSQSIHANSRTPTTRTTSHLKSSVCSSLLFFALVGWFIAGCIIVFRNYEPEFYNPHSPRYCNRTVYMFTFWLITSGLLILAMTVCTVIVCCVKPAVATRQSYGDEGFFRNDANNALTSIGDGNERRG